VIRGTNYQNHNELKMALNKYVRYCDKHTQQKWNLFNGNGTSNKPTLSISNDLKGLPFDISTYRTVLYRYDDFSITNQCRNTIKSFASEILNDLKTRGYSIDEQKKIVLPKKKLSIVDVNKNLAVKLSNIYQILGEIIPKINKATDIEYHLDLLYKTVEKLDNNVENAMNKIDKNEGTFSTDERFSILKGVFENGVEEIFKRRDDAYKKIIEILPNAEKRVDIMGISLRRFFHKQIDYNSDIKRILENHKADWRIMVIDPESEQALFRSLREEESTYNNMIKDPYSNYSMASYEKLFDKYLNTYTKMNLYRDVHRTTDDIDSLFNQRNLRIKLRYYRAAPVCFLAIIDESMFIELYHYGATSNERLAEQVPVFEFNGSSSMYKQMSGHFEYIWDKLSKELFISDKKPEEK